MRCLLAACVLATAPVRCLSPTEITVTITSNVCASLTETTVAVGSVDDFDTSAPRGTQSGCTSGLVGSIVILPSGAGDSVGIKVVGAIGKRADQCVHADPQCIVARRALGFLPHTPLMLPIALDSSCAGIACDDPATTCDKGVCIGAAIDSRTCAVGACVLDGGADAPVDSGSGLVVLASGQSAPAALAIDATNVYWTDPGGSAVRLCAKAGCGDNATTLVSDPSAATAFSIGVENGSVYYTSNATSGIVASCAVTGCGNNPTPLASGNGTPQSLALDTTAAYWTTPTAVLECPLGGCGGAAAALLSSTGPKAIAVDSSALYWTESTGNVRRCSLPACAAPTLLAAAQANPVALALDATSAYWTNLDDGTVMKCDKTLCSAPTVVASGQSSPVAIAIDGGNVYWSNKGGTIMKCQATGCVAPTTLATGQSAFSIAVDATSVYWANNAAGTIMKLTPK